MEHHHLSEFIDLLMEYFTSLDTVHSDWLGMLTDSNLPDPDNKMDMTETKLSRQGLLAFNNAYECRKLLRELAPQVVSKVVPPIGTTGVQFVSQLIHEVDISWHLCRFVDAIAPSKRVQDPDIQRLQNEMHVRFPALRNNLWEKWQHMCVALELSVQTDQLTSQDNSQLDQGVVEPVIGNVDRHTIPDLYIDDTEMKDDMLPAAIRKLAPSRIKAKAAYDWALSSIPNAEDMTISELYEAIECHPSNASNAIGPNAETFAKYLRDAGVKRYLGKGDKAPGSSITQPDEL